MINVDALQQRIDLINAQWPKRAYLPKTLIVACESAEVLGRAVQIVRNTYGTKPWPSSLSLVPVYLTDKLGIRSPNSSEYMRTTHFNLHPTFDRTWAGSTAYRRASQVVHVFTDCDLSKYKAASSTISDWLKNIVEFTDIAESDLYSMIPDTPPPPPRNPVILKPRRWPC